MTPKNPPRIYKKNAKSTPGWGYWGNFGEIEIGLSSGRAESVKNPQLENLHYHKVGTIFILVLEGIGIFEVDGEKLSVSKDEVLRIASGEKYRYVGVRKVPFSWIVICTSKDKDDKIVVEKYEL